MDVSTSSVNGQLHLGNKSKKSNVLSLSIQIPQEILAPGCPEGICRSKKSEVCVPLMSWILPIHMSPCVPAAPLPPTGTHHEGTWYGILGSAWPGWSWVSPPGCVPSWIPVKINPVLAEPRTP